MNLRSVLMFLFLWYFVSMYNAFAIVMGVLDTSMEARSVGWPFLTARFIMSIVPLLSLLVMRFQPLITILLVHGIKCLFKSCLLSRYYYFRQDAQLQHLPHIIIVRTPGEKLDSSHLHLLDSLVVAPAGLCTIPSPFPSRLYKFVEMCFHRKCCLGCLSLCRCMFTSPISKSLSNEQRRLVAGIILALYSCSSSCARLGKYLTSSLARDIILSAEDPNHNPLPP